MLLLSTIDSSFLVLPFGNDLLLIALISSRSRELPWMAYVIVAAIGSVLGVLSVDVIMRKTGQAGLSRFVGKQKLESLSSKILDKAELTIFFATLMPPPFPFTPVVMTASALQVPRKTLLTLVFVGRLIRFTIEGVLALSFGRRVIEYLNSEYLVYAVYGLIAVALIGSVMSLVKLRRPATAERS
ncbi:MAG: hypothetical protein C5B55_14055 [Blastocatellia bacterium]|nr:MAG: hypothetical protein C5B55_14055 [Blastocatellia bacterium]